MNEAELVLTHILECDRPSLYLNKDRRLDKDESEKLSAVLKRRLKNEPLQYILGSAEFMGLKFMVDRRVLIPRHETEILVEKAIEISGRLGGPRGRRLEILDIGTGSGCIAISLAKNIAGCRVTATDISADALEVARENASLHKAQIEFIQSDLFSSLTGRSFDLIVSNPPYIAKRELKDLDKEISFEPVLALEAGANGLDFYCRLISRAAAYLRKGGFFIMEMGFGQAGAIKNIVKKSGNFEIIEIVNDYNGVERVMVLWIS